MNDRARKTTRRSNLAPTRSASRISRSSAGPSPAVDPAANPISRRSATFVEPEQRQEMIAEAAYYRAEHRGFEPGYESEDWCAAETEIDEMLTRHELLPGCGI